MALGDGLVNYWSPWLGSSGYRLIDRTTYSNHGTLTNMDAGTDWVGATINGRTGYALDFDGVNDYVECGPCRNVNRYCTLSAWVMWRNLGNSSYYPMIVCRPAVATWINPFADFSLRIHGLNKRIDFGVNNLNVVANIVSGSTIITVDGLWHHVIGLYDGQNLEVWLDGKKDGTKALVAASINDSGRNILIAARQGVGEHNNCILADVSIHNRALTPAEIRTLYRLGPGWYQPQRRRSLGYVPAATTNRRRRILCGANC